MIRFSVSSRLFPNESSLGETADHLGKATRHAVGLQQLDDAPGSYDGTFSVLGDLLFGDVTCSGIAMRADAWRDSNDHAILYFMRTGVRHMMQNGHELCVGAGDSGLHMGDRSIDLWAHHESYLGLVVPRQRLLGLVGSEDSLTCRNFDRQSSTVAVLGSYLASVLNAPTVLDREPGEVIQRHLVELAALVIDGGRRARDAVHDEALPAARLVAAKRYIERHLANPDLGVERIAANLGISTAYVRKLFEQEGTSTARYIRERRLKWAADQLASPDLRGSKVIDIALSCGFNDISSFNRAFRRHFAMTPSDVRSTIEPSLVART
jgi:AraC-like DNA-binding protein